MFDSMIDKCIAAQWQTFSIFWQQAAHKETYIVLITLPTR